MTLLHSTSETAMNHWSHMYAAYMRLGALCVQDLLCKVIIFPLLLVLRMHIRSIISSCKMFASSLS